MLKVFIFVLKCIKRNYLVERYAVEGVLLEQGANEVLGFVRNVCGHLELGVYHFVKCVAYTVGVEGRSTRQESVHHAAKRPNVGLEAVCVARRNLWRYEVGRATHGEVLLVGYVELGGQAEVGYFDIHLFGEQQIGEGEISMEYAVRVQVDHAVDNLLQVVACLVFVEGLVFGVGAGF